MLIMIELLDILNDSILVDHFLREVVLILVVDGL